MIFLKSWQTRNRRKLSKPDKEHLQVTYNKYVAQWGNRKIFSRDREQRRIALLVTSYQKI